MHPMVAARVALAFLRHDERVKQIPKTEPSFPKFKGPKPVRPTPHDRAAELQRAIDRYGSGSTRKARRRLKIAQRRANVRAAVPVHAHR